MSTMMRVCRLCVVTCWCMQVVNGMYDECDMSCEAECEVERSNENKTHVTGWGSLADLPTEGTLLPGEREELDHAVSRDPLVRLTRELHRSDASCTYNMSDVVQSPDDYKYQPHTANLAPATLAPFSLRELTGGRKGFKQFDSTGMFCVFCKRKAHTVGSARSNLWKEEHKSASGWSVC